MNNKISNFTIAQACEVPFVISYNTFLFTYKSMNYSFIFLSNLLLLIAFHFVDHLCE